MNFKLIFLLFLLLTPCLSSLKAEDMASIESGEWHLSFALGAGVFSNPLSQIDDSPIWTIPSVTYYGERFYLNNFNMGYAIFENENFAIDFEGRLNDDGIYFESSSFSRSILASTVLGNRNPHSNFYFIPDEQFDRKLSYLAGFSSTIALSVIPLFNSV